MKKLKYRFLKWAATILNCDELIDSDTYEELVPRVYKIEKNSNLNYFHNNPDVLREYLSANKSEKPQLLTKIKSMGFGPGANTPILEHYEEVTRP